MERAADLHHAAMALADEGDRLGRVGECDAAKEKYLAACRMEESAARKLRPARKNEPSRSILYRSAASLAFQAHQYKYAQRLIYSALLGYPPPVIERELKDLLNDVSFSEHLDVQGVSLSPSTLELSLWGELVGRGVADSSKVLSRWSAMTKLLYRSAERLMGVAYREKGEPSKQIMNQFRVYAAIPRPASYAIAFRLGGRHSQGGLFGAHPARVVEDLMETFELIERDQMDAIAKKFANRDDYLQNFFGLAGQIVPDGEDVRHVGIATVINEQIRELPIRKSRPRVMAIPGEILKATNREAFSETLEGTLHSADAGRGQGNYGMVGIEDASGKRVFVQVPRGLMADVVRPYFGRLVTVVATRHEDRVVLDDIQECEVSADAND